MRILVVLLLLTGGPLTGILSTRVAAAHPPPELAYDEPTDWRSERALAEWSSWIRLGYGVASQQSVAANQPSGISPRAIGEPITTYETSGHFDAALGADVTFPLPTSKVRMGPWLELRPDDAVAGLEVSVAGEPVDMFWYEGERVFTVRAGMGFSHVTAALAYGYRCPWKLWGPYNKTSRYMIGVRLVASGSRAMANPDDWNVSFGLEFEPAGSLRYVGGIKSWY